MCQAHNRSEVEVLRILKRGASSVSVAHVCVTITNTPSPKSFNQPQQDPSHLLCEDTDVGGGYISPLCVQTTELSESQAQLLEKIDMVVVYEVPYR